MSRVTLSLRPSAQAALIATTMRHEAESPIEKALSYYVRARQRAQRRKSPWNVFLFFVCFVAFACIWYASFQLIWRIHTAFYPDHQFQNFWRAGISFRAFVPSFLMMFGIAPGALISALITANLICWTLPFVRRTLDREAAEHPGTDFHSTTRLLFRCWLWTFPAGLIVASVAAILLRSLK